MASPTMLLGKHAVPLTPSLGGRIRVTSLERKQGGIIMSDKKPESSITINIDNLVRGNVHGAVGNGSTVVNGTIKIIYGGNKTVVINANDPFYDAYTKIASKPGHDKTNLINEVEMIRQEVQTGQNIRQEFLHKRLINLSRMSKDIFDVVVATLTNPVNGFAEVARKIAQKAQDECNQTTR